MRCTLLLFVLSEDSLMATPLSGIAIQQFRDTFTNKYQASRKLMGACQEIHGIVGDSYKFPILGNYDLYLRGAYQSVVPGVILNHTQKSISFENYVGNVPVDRGEQTLVNASEREQLAAKHAAAAGRRIDQWCFDALEASTTTNTIANGGTNLDLAKIVGSAYYLNKNNVPMTDRYFITHANQLQAILKLEQLTSSDYNSVRMLTTGEMNTFMGFHWIVVGDYSTDGLYKTGNIRTNYAFHKEALGLGFRMDPTVNVEYSVSQMSWLSTMEVIGGAVAILDEGIVHIDCDETV